MSQKHVYTLQEWINSESLKNLMRVKKSTIDARRNVINKYFVPAVGNKILADITPEDILAVLQSLEGSLEKTTISTIHSALSSVLNVAWKHEHIPYNPCERVSSKPPYRLIPEIIRCR